MGMTCSTNWRYEKAYKTLVRKPEVKRLLRSSRHKWKDNTATNLWEMEWKSVNWIHLTKDRDQWQALVNTVMNLQNP
jgi:hypothetical protein